eukprot:CAMPEP_0197425090 /NCGR_PEP_ID=MMETSP1170-20131217/29368_1 /TAXON_ID=54406 /ORGANISM="Sarcinochrysis sp, Strain CCMP770" /LENGTH=162 /DNA_ID=CAMNT_0042952619 /DNA_START=49 /DNA_END=534 /DNA_ORIENTATION=+
MKRRRGWLAVLVCWAARVAGDDVYASNVCADEIDAYLNCERNSTRLTVNRSGCLAAASGDCATTRVATGCVAPYVTAFECYATVVCETTVVCDVHDDVGIASYAETCPTGWSTCDERGLTWCCDESSDYDECGDSYLDCEKSAASSSILDRLARLPLVIMLI